MLPRPPDSMSSWPKPCMDLDFTHAIKMSGTMLKITLMCAVVTGQYHNATIP